MLIPSLRRLPVLAEGESGSDAQPGRDPPDNDFPMAIAPIVPLVAWVVVIVFFSWRTGGVPLGIV